MNLIEVRKAPKGYLPYEPNSIYKYHSLRKFPALIYKVGGILIFDMDEWGSMAEVAKKQNVKKAAGLRK